MRSWIGQDVKTKSVVKVKESIWPKQEALLRLSWSKRLCFSLSYSRSGSQGIKKPWTSSCQQTLCHWSWLTCRSPADEVQDTEAMFCHHCDDSLAGHRWALIFVTLVYQICHFFSSLFSSISFQVRPPRWPSLLHQGDEKRITGSIDISANATDFFSTFCSVTRMCSPTTATSVERSLESTQKTSHTKRSIGTRPASSATR